MTQVHTLEAAVIALAALCIIQAIALVYVLARRRRRHSFVEQTRTVRRIPSLIDPKGAPAPSFFEAPSSAAVHPAVAEQRLVGSSPR